MYTLIFLIWILLEKTLGQEFKCKSFIWEVQEVLVREKGGKRGRGGHLVVSPPREIQSQRGRRPESSP